MAARKNLLGWLLGAGPRTARQAPAALRPACPAALRPGSSSTPPPGPRVLRRRPGTNPTGSDALGADVPGSGDTGSGDALGLAAWYGNAGSTATTATAAPADGRPRYSTGTGDAGGKRSARNPSADSGADGERLDWTGSVPDTEISPRELVNSQRSCLEVELLAPLRGAFIARG